MIVRTRTGSTYMFDAEKKRVVRVRESGDGTMRKDGDWLRVLRREPIIVGEPMVLYLEGVSDDPDVLMTQRRTSAVVAITEEGGAQ